MKKSQKETISYTLKEKTNEKYTLETASGKEIGTGLERKKKMRKKDTIIAEKLWTVVYITGVTLYTKFFDGN